MRKMQIIMAGVLCAALGAGADAWDGASWSENFDTLSALPSNLELGLADPASVDPGTIAVTNDQVEWSENNFRQFVRTTATNYNTMDYSFEGTVTINGDGAFDTAFFGMADGDCGTQNTWMPAGVGFSVGIDPRDGKGATEIIDNGWYENFAPGLSAGTHRVRLDWDASTGGGIISIDADYAAPAAFTVDYATTNFHNVPFESGTTNSLFFGGGSGVVFDHITVTNAISAPIELAPPPSPYPSWSEDFDGLSALPSNLELGAGQGSVTVTVFSNQVNWSETDGRQFVRAVEPQTNYFSMNFIFEGTATIEGDSAYDTVFFGMSAGDVTSWMPSGVAIGMAIDPRSGAGGTAVINQVFPFPAFAPGVSVGTHRLRMEWTASNKVAVLSIDTNYVAGAFSADFSEARTNTSFNMESDSRLFFGGGSGAVFDDISFNSLDWIPPVPATILSLSAVPGDMVEMVVNTPLEASRYSPLARTDLITGSSWTNVAHSDTNDVTTLVYGTNLSYSTVDATGTNEVIYLDAGDAAKFFKIIGE